MRFKFKRLLGLDQAGSALLAACIALLPVIHIQGALVMDKVRNNGRLAQNILFAMSIPLAFLAGLAHERRRRLKKLEKLSDSDARYRALVMASADMVWRANQKGQAFYVTPEWENLTGQREEQMEGFGWLAAVHPDDRDRSRRLWEQAVKTKQICENELRIRTRDGTYRNFRINAVPILTAAGEVQEWIGANTDITVRKRSESSLNIQCAMTRAMAESASLAEAAPAVIEVICDRLGWKCGEIWQLNDQGSRLHCAACWHVPSKEIEEFAAANSRLEIAPGEGLPGRVWEEKAAIWTSNISDDDGFLRAEDALKAGLRSVIGVPIAGDKEMRGVLVLFTGENEGRDDDLLQMMNLVGTQMGQFTDRKLAEKALSDSKARLKLAIESARIGYWEFELDSGKFTWSSSLVRLFGLDSETFKGNWQTFYEMVLAEDRDRPREQSRRCIQTLGSDDAEYRILHADGTVHWIASRIQALPGSDGRAARLLGLTTDITERKRAAEALEAALEEVSRLKERTEAENIYLREEVSQEHRFGEIIGRSDAMLRVLMQAEKVAPTDTTVLILGETGTGKELLARAVHARSHRGDRPLVKLNCAALPASLIESELFGHERGAFTGAAGKRVGRFELADGATIFLDEIGELPLEVQAKLLRVLQEGEFERLGSSKTIKVNVRVIAATNRNLHRAMQEGKFRQDLYYRLNVYPIHLPPLRERMEDVGLLAMECLANCCQRLGRSFDTLPQQVIEQLKSYHWPGNVRELQNLIERAAVVSTGRSFRLPEQWVTKYLPEINEPGPSTTAAERLTTLEEMERAHVLRVLSQTRWRIEGPKGAAAILGLKPSTLRSRMNKLHIRRFENKPACENPAML